MWNYSYTYDLDTKFNEDYDNQLHFVCFFVALTVFEQFKFKVIIKRQRRKQNSISSISKFWARQLMCLDSISKVCDASVSRAAKVSDFKHRRASFVYRLMAPLSSKPKRSCWSICCKSFYNFSWFSFTLGFILNLFLFRFKKIKN